MKINHNTVLQMSKYKRIDLKERENIYRLLQLGENQASIAKRIGRNKSTISREVKRCRFDPLGYLPDRANSAAQGFARRNLGLFRSAKLRLHTIDLLKLGMTPEQISGRLWLEVGIRASHETIYKFIYSPEGQEQQLYSYLIKRKPKVIEQKNNK